MKEERNIISINEYCTVILPTDIQVTAMSEWELCELFGVIAPTLRAAIRAVYKSGVLKEYDTKRHLHLSDGCSLDVYSLDMVVALAFRIDSFGASKVRSVLLAKIMYWRKEKTYLFTLPLGSEWHC